MKFKHVESDFVLPELQVDTTKTGRFYTTPEGNKYPSITTVMSWLKEDSLREWRERIGYEEAGRITARAGERGTYIHELVEKYIDNHEIDRRDHMPTYWQTFLQIKEIIDAYVDDVVLQEAALYSDFLKLAGRCDLIARFGKEMSIIDFKTSIKTKRSEWIETYFMQEAFYAEAFRERTGIDIERLVTIIAVDEGRPQVFIRKKSEFMEPLMQARLDYNKEFGL